MSAAAASRRWGRVRRNRIVPATAVGMTTRVPPMATNWMVRPTGSPMSASTGAASPDFEVTVKNVIHGQKAIA
ncbi:hypothetical protein NORO109296_26835 [Nocardiopsis rhodophaea]